MRPEHRARVLAVVNGLALAAWAAFLWWAYATGVLEFLHPSFRRLSLFAAIGMVALAGAMLTGAMPRRGHAACAQAHAHATRGVGFAVQLGMRAALGIPVVLGVTVPMHGLSAGAVARRGVRMIRVDSQASTSGPDASQPDAPAPPPTAKPVGEGPGQVKAPRQAAKPATSPASDQEPVEEFYEEISVQELLGRLRRPGGEAAVQKIRIAMVGQYYKDEDCTAQQFKLYRVIITCCLADAEVMALLVETKQLFTRKMAGEDKDRDEANALTQEARISSDAQSLRLAGLVADLGGWVRAKGRLRIVCGRDGYNTLKLLADKVERIEPPTQKYMFVNGDAGMAF